MITAMEPEPEIGRRYLLVRVVVANVAIARFTRWADGSAGGLANYTREGEHFEFVSQGAIRFGADESETAWKALWAELLADGLIELSAAKAAGLLPPDWRPPFPFDQLL